MAFGREIIVQPVSIGDISVELFDPEQNSGQTQSIMAQVQIIMDDGSIRHRRINLSEHLPAQTLTQLQSLMATIRTRANAEILPE